MRFGFPQYFESKARYQTYHIVKIVLEKGGHEIVPHIDGVDAVLFSMCDVMEYRKLIALRKKCKNVPLIVGGAYAFNFWSAKLYCDAVWVGEVFDMAECRTLEELFESEHCYTGGDKLPKASQRIEWDMVPVVQTDSTRCYYWGGVGCANKCRFCYTSWTHKHQTNKKSNLALAKRAAKKKGKFIMITSNEYDNDPDSSTFDMLLKDYKRIPVKRGKTVRAGVEFATEESRSRNGKPISKDDLFKCIQKSTKEGVSLYLFHITGYDTREDWERYIEEMAVMFRACKFKRMISLGFNNLQYQNYTPLYAERKDIDPSRYTLMEDTLRWREYLAMNAGAVWAYPPMPFQHVCCRMGIELSTDKEQVDYWSAKIVSAAKKLTVDEAYDSLFDTGIMDTPPLSLKHSTGEIFINEKWR